MLNTSKYMGWEKCSIDLKIALITNSFGHKLSNDKRKVHAKNYVSKCNSFRPTVKRILKNRRPSILAKTLYICQRQEQPFGQAKDLERLLVYNIGANSHMQYNGRCKTKYCIRRNCFIAEYIINTCYTLVNTILLIRINYI